ncbi:type IV secretory system conjugative DNA transfer family protein [Bradyrhizobium sp. CW9]|nr:type IV secretory system conjugative DNA transfer family protein [Bradyrhizobium sp. CW9]
MGKTSHFLPVGAILHVLYAEADKTLAGAQLGDRVHPVVASAARELLNKSENERSGVLSTTMSFLGLYRDPVVAKVTARSDWRILDLADKPQPVSLYLVVPPSDIFHTKVLIWLILNQIGRRLTESLDPDRRRQKLLLMLDESCSSGLPRFVREPACIHGRLWHSQFPDHSELEPVRTRLWAEPRRQSSHPDSRLHNDDRTAKRVSDALRTATELRAMKNYAGHRISPWLGHLMVSRQETSRPLLTPGEVMQLSSKEAIVMVSGLHPLRATKVRYHEDPQFQKRIFKPLKQQQFSCPRARMRTGRGTHPLRPRSNGLRLGSESMATRTGGSGASQNCRSTRRSKSRHRSRNMSSMLLP